MQTMARGRTCLLIAHRLATVRDADRIIVLKAGEILEEGSPAELLAAGGLYATLHRHNFSSFDEIESASEPGSGQQLRSEGAQDFWRSPTEIIGF